MSTEISRAVVLDVLDAIEAKDFKRLDSLYHPDAEFHWPPGLPYGGSYRGAAVSEMTRHFRDLWAPFRLTEADRRMDARVIAAEAENVVVQYTWRGRDRAGRILAADTLAHYRVQDGKLASARMYHYDLISILDFLAAGERR